MSDTPITDAAEQRCEQAVKLFMKMPASQQAASLSELVVDITHELLTECRKIESQLETCRAVTTLCCEKKASAVPEELLLTQKAQIGATVFGVGVKWSTVIDRAQREWDYFHGLKNPRSSDIDSAPSPRGKLDPDLRQVSDADEHQPQGERDK